MVNAWPPVAWWTAAIIEDERDLAVFQDVDPAVGEQGDRDGECLLRGHDRDLVWHVGAVREAASLVHQDESLKYEGFVLMHEGGRLPHGPNMPYQVPVVPPEQAFPIPVTLFTNGWIHILEDSEIAFILMMAAVHHATGGQAFTITAETRLLRFGMKHDGYEAHLMLRRLGLVTVTPDGRRRPDGTVEDFNSEGIRASSRAQLHPSRLRSRRHHHAPRRDRPPTRPRLLTMAAALLTGPAVGKADKMTEFAKALFSYDSAGSHTDPHLRDIAWRRENAGPGPRHRSGSLASGPAVVAALAFAGVVLPAVWSRRPARRAAAAKVLAELLGVFRRRPGR